jgi:ribosomal protein S18 acetylase RimI-like enzyme
MTITSRPADTIDDLQVACDLLTRAWLDEAPFVTWTPGDLSWWFAQAWPTELSERLRLWSADDRVVGWSWQSESALESHVWSGDPAVDDEVARAILAGAAAAATTPGHSGGDGRLDVWAADEDERALERLRGLGFVSAPPREGRHSSTGSQFRITVLDPPAIPDHPLPDGYRIRSVAGPADLEARVDVHRAAFAPSRMTVRKYERLIALPAYRLEDDLVVQAPDGSLVAFAMAWWDPVARVGEFEPVGTHPDHRRLGLGAALLSHALGRYATFGARLAQVYSDAENIASEALYQSVGFRRHTFFRAYRRRSG